MAPCVARMRSDADGLAVEGLGGVGVDVQALPPRRPESCRRSRWASTLRTPISAWARRPHSFHRGSAHTSPVTESGVGEHGVDARTGPGVRSADPHDLGTGAVEPGGLPTPELVPAGVADEGPPRVQDCRRRRPSPRRPPGGLPSAQQFESSTTSPATWRTAPPRSRSPPRQARTVNRGCSQHRGQQHPGRVEGVVPATRARPPPRPRPIPAATQASGGRGARWSQLAVNRRSKPTPVRSSVP